MMNGELSTLYAQYSFKIQKYRFKIQKSVCFDD